MTVVLSAERPEGRRQLRRSACGSHTPPAAGAQLEPVAGRDRGLARPGVGALPPRALRRVHPRL